jgi:hypothetical protein
MSSQSQPILGCAVPCFELFMTLWEKVGKTNKHAKYFIEIGLYWANIYYNWMDNTQAYVIAMRKS